MRVLSQKKILLGVTAGIAAYKAAFLVRLLVKQGAEVKVVMTPKAKEFVTPLTLSTLSKNEVHSSFTNQENDNAQWNNHVELALWADLFIIAQLLPIRFQKWHMAPVIIYYWPLIFLQNVLFILLPLWIWICTSIQAPNKPLIL